MTNKRVKMEQQTEEPRVCQEPDVLKTLRPDPPESPPPNCAICLGTCTNKCFTDCCLHQFCFSCLLEWSKIKAECPLCKQPFKSIIYNIKSNLEYEEHIITNPERENQEDLLTLNDPSDYLFLPNGPRPQRHFQYRTTFTLEPGGEFAIQQLLLSHPRTNSISFPSDRYPYPRFNFSTHSVDQRRNIYIEDWWVDPQADVTGRFRDCSPSFFRENPAQAHRIIPWLNRELTALINHTLIYPVQQAILDLLCHYPILSSQFRSNIVQHLGARTDHFVHEFYNFVRSPYDMIGYDRHSTYRRHGVMPIYDLSDEDSDVHVVDTPENDDCVFVPNRTPEVIVIDSESSGNDSDVIMRTPTPPPIVDLVNDSSTEEENVEVPTLQQQQQQQQEPQAPSQNQNQDASVDNDRNDARSPQLPIKIRLKRSKSSTEICNYYKHKEKRRLKRSRSSSSTSSDNSSSTESYNSSSKSSSDYYKYVKKKSKLSNRKHNKNDTKYLTKNSKNRYKKSKSDYSKAKKSKRSSKKSKKQKKSKRKDNDKRHKNIKIEKSDTSYSSASASASSSSDVGNSSSDEDNNYHRRKKPKLFYEIKTENSNSSEAQNSHPHYEPEVAQSATDTPVSAAAAPSASASSSPSSTSQSTVATETNSVSSPVAAATTTFSTNNAETNSDHWSTTSIASSCPSSNNVAQDLSVAGPSNGVTVQSMVFVKDKNGSLWCRGNNYQQPSKRYRLYRPDLNRSSDNSSDSD